MTESPVAAKNILLIDDDALVVKAVDRYLKSQGYHVEVAQSGKDALEKIGKANFDLVISDIRMPDMNGIETLKKIRESGAAYSKEKIPAIIITGYAGGDDVYRSAQELGITECVYKPFELGEFIGVIKRALELSAEPKEALPEVKAVVPVEIDKEFISLTKEFRDFLQDIKDKFDAFDKQNSDEKKQIAFIEGHKKEVFVLLDDYFAKSWEMVNDFEKEKYLAYQKYYQKMLGYLLLELVETNKHVYQKPLGYAGDYMMMNYIYDYYADRYIGATTYAKLMNNYTCNIPISRSNIQRKDFLKEKIIETIERKDKAQILSVSCGPARELIELLKEGRITKPLLFKCLDFEKRALDYIDAEINKIEPKKKELLSLEYICRDAVSIIRDKNLKKEFQDCDLIYVFGLFDYLSDRMASRLAKELFQLLQKEGYLLICNANLKNASHRAYYEMVGGWSMVYRTKDEMLLWVNDINDSVEAKFEYPTEVTNYLFLAIKKL